MLDRYKPSGAVAPLTPVFLIPLAVAGAAIGAVDGVACFYNRWVFFTFVLPFFFVVGVGYATYKVVGVSHCRNRWVGYAMGAWTGVAAVVAAHTVMYLLARGAAAAPPADFLDYLHLKVSQGWTASRPVTTRVAGIITVCFWSLEALVVILSGLLGAEGAVSDAYCEGCGRRASRLVEEVVIPGLTGPAVERLRKAETLDELLHPPLDGAHTDFQAVVYELRGCPGCDRTRFLSISWRETTFDAKGKSKVADSSIRQQVVFPPELAPELDRLKDRAAAALAKAPPVTRGGRQV